MGEFYDSHKRLECQPLVQFAINNEFEDLQGSICAVNQHNEINFDLQISYARHFTRHPDFLQCNQMRHLVLFWFARSLTMNIQICHVVNLCQD